MSPMSDTFILKSPSIPNSPFECTKKRKRKNKSPTPRGTRIRTILFLFLLLLLLLLLLLSLLFPPSSSESGNSSTGELWASQGVMSNAAQGQAPNCRREQEHTWQSIQHVKEPTMCHFFTACTPPPLIHDTHHHASLTSDTPHTLVLLPGSPDPTIPVLPSSCLIDIAFNQLQSLLTYLLPTSLPKDTDEIDNSIINITIHIAMVRRLFLKLPNLFPPLPIAAASAHPPAWRPSSHVLSIVSASTTRV